MSVVPPSGFAADRGDVERRSVALANAVIEIVNADDSSGAFGAEIRIAALGAVLGAVIRGTEDRLHWLGYAVAVTNREAFGDVGCDSFDAETGDV